MISKTTSRIILLMTIIVISIITYLINSDSFIKHSSRTPGKIALGDKPLKQKSIKSVKKEAKKIAKTLKSGKQLPDIGKSLKEKQTVRIGVSLPLSGPNEISGDALRSAINMAFNEIPKNTKFNYDIVIEDSGKEKTFMSTYALVDIKKVDALLSVYDDSLIVAPIAEKNRIPHIACSWNEVFLKKNKYSYNHFPSYKHQAKSFLDNLEDNNIRIFSMVSMEDSFYVEIAKEIEKQAKKRNFIIPSRSTIKKGTTKFSKQIKEIEEKNPEAVLLLMNISESSLMASKLNRNKNTFRYTAIDMMSEINKNLMNGAVFVSYSRGDYTFREKFRRASILPVPSCAPNVYDAVKMLVLAFENTNKKIKPFPKDVISNISLIQKFNSATGEEVSVGQDRMIDSPMESAEIYNNRIYYKE